MNGFDLSNIAQLRPKDGDLDEERIPVSTSGLEGHLNSDGSSEKSDLRGIRVRSYPALIQAVGYLKYKWQNENSQSAGPVYFRGQTKVYGCLVPQPSAYRAGSEGVESLKKKLESLIGQDDASDYSEDLVCKDLPFHDVPKYTVEPLLQHYGLETRWLDVTDALPYALYFCLAQYESLTITKSLNAVYDPTSGGSCASRFFKNVVVRLCDEASLPGDDVYLYAISPGAYKEHNWLKTPGLVSYTCGDIVDARIAVPSMYLRPHSQHGLLFKPREQSDQLGSQIEFVVFVIERRLVAEWLGSGLMFSPKNVYPPLRVLRPQSNNPRCKPYRTADRGLASIENWARKRYRSNLSLGEFDWLRNLVNYVTLDQLMDDEKFMRETSSHQRLDWKL